MSTGFDSGSSLDYVYQNQPQGSNAFGRLVDKIYLNSVGWRGIRQRKTHLQMLIKQAGAHSEMQARRVRPEQFHRHTHKAIRQINRR